MYEDKAVELIKLWYAKSQREYDELYVHLYVAYNAWYRKVTHTDFDREAIARLKRRTGIWVEYAHEEAMAELRPYMREISLLTQNASFRNVSGKWYGVVEDDNDWHNLIEFWYQVRCSLFHGNEAVDSRFDRFTYLAYQSLNVFMKEIVCRMDLCVTSAEVSLLREMEEIPLSNATPQVEKMRFTLREKYIKAPDIWQVDL